MREAAESTAGASGFDRTPSINSVMKIAGGAGCYEEELEKEVEEVGRERGDHVLFREASAKI